MGISYKSAQSKRVQFDELKSKVLLSPLYEAVRPQFTFDRYDALGNKFVESKTKTTINKDGTTTQAEEEEEPGFLRKYWWALLLAFVVMQVLGGGSKEEEGAEGG